MSLLCPGSLHIPHPRGARTWLNSKLSRYARGGGSSIASSGCIINADPSWTEGPCSAGICLLDRVRFRFCLLLAARNSVFYFASKMAPCIISWFKIRSDGLGGLWDLVRSKALIDETCRRSSFSVEVVFGVKFLLDSLPRLGVGGVGVRSRISSFKITSSGRIGTKQVAPKLFLIGSNLKTHVHAFGYTSRKSSLSIWLPHFCLNHLTIRPF